MFMWFQLFAPCVTHGETGEGPSKVIRNYESVQILLIWDDLEWFSILEEKL